MPIIYATYESRCGICDDVIEEGDAIESFEDEWCHAACVDDERLAHADPEEATEDDLWHL